MSQYTVIQISDYTASTRVEMILTPDDFTNASDNWESGDQLLEDLQGLEMFHGRRRWCDLTPTHFRLLAARNLDKVSELDDDARGDLDNPTVASLNFLFTMLIWSIQSVAANQITSMNVCRFGEMMVSIQYTSTMDEYAAPPPPSNNGLKVIVDNTN